MIAERKMELNIISENDNPLFGRKEIKAELVSEITPNRLQILDAISKKFTVPIESIKIKGIWGGFGTKTFTIEANIYNSKENKEAVELKKKKEGVVAPVKVAETPAPA